MPRKVPELPRATVWVDERGRITIPQYLREAAGIPEGDGLR
jgi:AbrB family looped-hinge helix DNA binding protein